MPQIIKQLFFCFIGNRIKHGSCYWLMKSTYKLLGVEWDHSPLPLICPDFIEYKSIEPYSAERNVFDMVKYERRIDISEILSSSSDNLEAIVNAVKECDSIYINIDYEPYSKSIDVHSFYYLRVLQVIAYFENNLDNNTILVMGSEVARRKCREKWVDKKERADGGYI